jgi:hypothetical protein
MVQDVLVDRDAMPRLDMGRIRDYSHAFFQFGAHHDSRLWALLIFGLWRRHAKGGGGRADSSGSARPGLTGIRSETAPANRKTPAGGRGYSRPAISSGRTQLIRYSCWVLDGRP